MIINLSPWCANIRVCKTLYGNFTPRGKSLSTDLPVDGLNVKRMDPCPERDFPKTTHCGTRGKWATLLCMYSNDRVLSPMENGAKSGINCCQMTEPSKNI